MRPSGDVREVRIRGLGLVPGVSINKDVQSAPPARRAERDGEQKPGQNRAPRRPPLVNQVVEHLPMVLWESFGAPMVALVVSPPRR